MSLHSLADAVILRMAALHADSAVVVGGGLIGCKAASSLAMRGLSTTLVAPEPVPLLRRFGLEVGERVHEDVVRHAAAGLATANGRIVVDEYMRTSLLNVYAAGDVALAYNVTARRRIPAEHWRDAARQGRIAGEAAAGFPSAWDTVPEFSCFIAGSKLTYRGWGVGYDESSLVEGPDGFTLTYRSGGQVVGILSATASPAF